MNTVTSRTKSHSRVATIVVTGGHDAATDSDSDSLLALTSYHSSTLPNFEYLEPPYSSLL